MCSQQCLEKWHELAGPEDRGVGEPTPPGGAGTGAGRWRHQSPILLRIKGTHSDDLVKGSDRLSNGKCVDEVVIEQTSGCV